MNTTGILRRNRWRSSTVREYLSGKIVGGGSSINGLIYSRGLAVYSDYWRQLGCTGWSFSDVLPYFKRSEEANGEKDLFTAQPAPWACVAAAAEAANDAAFLKAVADEGYPIVDDLVSDREGFGYYDTNVSPGGRRMSAAVAYLRPAIKRGNSDCIQARPCVACCSKTVAP